MRWIQRIWWDFRSIALNVPRRVRRQKPRDALLPSGARQIDRLDEVLHQLGNDLRWSTWSRFHASFYQVSLDDDG